MRYLSGAALLLLAASSHAIEPANPRDYGLSLSHRILSQIPLDSGINGIEVELTLGNAGAVALHDLRLHLHRLTPGCIATEQEPARLVHVGAQQASTLVWTFEVPGGCAPIPVDRPLWVLEAVDAATQQIRSFTLYSEAR